MENLISLERERGRRIQEEGATKPIGRFIVTSKESYEDFLEFGRYSCCGSKYDDRFDYSVYTRLREQYKGTNVRGGVIYKTDVKLLDVPDCANCFYRFEIDTYGRGCTHNCLYCYSRSYLHVRDTWNNPQPFPINIRKVRHMFYRVFETDKASKWRHILEKRIPLRIGNMSDGFLYADKKYRVTYELLKILKFYNYPYVAVTRSDLVADDQYLEVLDPNLAGLQISLISSNDTINRLIEPGAPSAKRRLAAIEKLSKAGFWTTVRINPLFPIYPDGYFTNREFDKRAAKPLGIFDWDMIDEIAAHGCHNVLAGIVRLYSPNLFWLNQALGIKIQDYFDRRSGWAGAAYHLSKQETNYYYTEIKKRALKAGMEFTVCYIGNDPHGESYQKYQPLWSNANDCCNVACRVKGITTTCRALREELPPHKPASPPDASFKPGLTVKKEISEKLQTESGK